MIRNLISRRSPSAVAFATAGSCPAPTPTPVKTSQTYYHRNQQYSIVGLTNAAGTLVERYTYNAYGTLGIYAANGTVRSSSTYANRYTYTGREWDADLKLYHFRARLYDPATGGFVTRDPLGYVDGMSLYRGYFSVSGMDPTGYHSLSDCADELLWCQNDAIDDRNDCLLGDWFPEWVCHHNFKIQWGICQARNALCIATADETLLFVGTCVTVTAAAVVIIPAIIKSAPVLLTGAVATGAIVLIVTVCTNDACACEESTNPPTPPPGPAPSSQPPVQPQPPAQPQPPMQPQGPPTQPSVPPSFPPTVDPSGPGTGVLVLPDARNCKTTFIMVKHGDPLPPGTSLPPGWPTPPNWPQPGQAGPPGFPHPGSAGPPNWPRR